MAARAPSARIGSSRPTTDNKGEEKEKTGKRVRATTENSDARRSRIAIVSPTITKNMFKGTIQTTVCATLPNGIQREHSFETSTHDSELGRGSFGRVYLATLQHSHQAVAIKTVHLDRRYANRELEFLLTLDHPNVIKVVFYYFTDEFDGHIALEGNAYLHIGMEYIPETLHAYVHRFRKRGYYLPIFAVKLICYQLFRGLAFLHSHGIAHRDIKPSNVLFNEANGVTKICDLGSMKRLDNSSPSVSYICSRHYRAPELLCGSTKYTWAIDIWSAGCTMAELILQRPLFPGADSADQLSRILKVLGSPSPKRTEAFCKEIGIPLQKAELHKLDLPVVNLSTIFPIHVPYDGIEVLGQLLKLTPSQRLSMADSLAAPFFDELREPGCLLRKDIPLPPLFDFSDEECKFLPKGLVRNHDSASSLPSRSAPSSSSSEPEFQSRRKRTFSNNSSGRSGSRPRSMTPPARLSSDSSNSHSHYDSDSSKDTSLLDQAHVVKPSRVRRQSSSE